MYAFRMGDALQLACSVPVDYLKGGGASDAHVSSVKQLEETLGKLKPSLDLYEWIDAGHDQRRNKAI